MEEVYNKRHKYYNNGVFLYEWEQSLDEVNIYLNTEFNIINKKLIEVKIKSKSISVGLKNEKPFLEGELFGIINEECSYWFIDQNRLHILLTKAIKGEAWTYVIKGHKCLNPLDEENTKKKILLERFQEEYPTFDFSSAAVNGQVPDARTFMGGLKY